MAEGLPVRDDHVASAINAEDRHTLTAEGQLIAGWFIELHNARISSGFGPVALQFSEIEAWARLTGVTLNVWTVRLLRLVDGIYLRLSDDRAQREMEKR